MNESHMNIERFMGFADLYDSIRPKCPEYVVDLLVRYLGFKPHTVVDIGCGTGLSTLVWQNIAEEIIGIDPSKDMIRKAGANAKEIQNITFSEAFSDNTKLDDNTADIVTCSQSFHWMEPQATLAEINRILKSGGIFAAYDSDWPPVCAPSLDLAYATLDEWLDSVEIGIIPFKRYPKSEHLENMKRSGYFKYTREIVFSNTENCDASRYFGFILSQGGTQGILRKNPSLIEKELIEFKDMVDSFFGDRILEIEFCYRMRLGIKSI